MSDLNTLLDSRYAEIKELIERLYADEKQTIGYNPTIPTLKATLFLLYYNLIESIIYSTFEMLFDEIAVNCTDFFNLTPCVQEQYKKYDKESNISENDLLRLDLSKYSGKITLFSGNLDARAIRALLHDWGIADDFHADGEVKLRDIRQFRNVLAHGERAFKEVGKDYSVKEIEQYGKVVYNYLHHLVQIINCFFSTRQYLTT